MDIFHISRQFPKEETYSLTSQVIRSSRSISANIVEGWAKRTYENKFKVHLVDALGSAAETQNWILFAKDCGYMNERQYSEYNDQLDHIGKMLTRLHQNWETKSKQHKFGKFKLRTSSIELLTSNIECPREITTKYWV